MDEQIKVLYWGLEYSIRNTRHLIDYMWIEHNTLTGHKRALLENTPSCAACILLAGSTQQNNALFLQISKENRVLNANI